MGVSENLLQIEFFLNHVPYFLHFCYYPITMNGANPVPKGSPRAQLDNYWIYPSVRSLRWMFQCGTIQRAYKPYGRLQHSSGVISMGALATQTMIWICPMHQVRSFWPFASVQTCTSSFTKGRSCFGTSLIHIHPPVHHGRLIRWPKFTLHTTLRLTPFFKTGWYPGNKVYRQSWILTS